MRLFSCSHGTALFRITLLLGSTLTLGCASSSTKSKAKAASDTAESSPPSAQQTEAEPRTAPIQLVSGVWSPFTDQKDRPRLAIDIVQAALNRAGYATQSHITSPTEVMDDLKAGKFDGSEALWETDERKEYLEYSMPYLQNRLVLLARKGSDVSMKDLNALSGKKLGLVSSYAYGPEILEAKGPEQVFGKSDEDNLRALLQEELDYILVDDLLVYYLFAYDGERAEELLSAGTHPMTTRGLHLALQKTYPHAHEIIEAFNAQIRVMIRDGSYNDLLKVNWLLADHDGDGNHEYILNGESAGSAPPNRHYQLTPSAPLATGPGLEGPHFLVGGQVYNSWEAVPEQYKVPQPLPEPIDTFKPGINLVLVGF